MINTINTFLKNESDRDHIFVFFFVRVKNPKNVLFDDSPTILDSQYYHMEQNMDFVVDGDQNYWVRIGNVKAAGLSTNAYANILCKGVIIVGAAGTAYALGPVIAAGEGIVIAIGGTTVTITSGSIAAIMGATIGFVADEVAAACSEVEKWFVDSKYRVVASDGTILLVMNKTNTAGIQELAKHGLDIEKLTHVTKEGMIVQTCPQGQRNVCGLSTSTCGCK